MMKKIWALAGVFFLWIGCNDAPVWPMEEEKLVNLLVDLHVAEAAANNLHGTLKDSVINVYYNQVFTIHDIDSVKFDQVYNQLEAQPELHLYVYELVINEIGRREAERTKLNKERDTKPKHKLNSKSSSGTEK